MKFKKMMDGSMGMGCMAVFAVSGSVAVLAYQFYKRLMSNFMKKIEFEFGSEKCQPKRSAHIIKEEKKWSNYEGKCLTRQGLKKTQTLKLEGCMPLNRLALYRGIIQNRMLFLEKDIESPTEGTFPSAYKPRYE